MDQSMVYIMLFGIIALVGQVFNKSVIPIALLLVIVGMMLSFVPGFPEIELNPDLVLNIFLPVLIYQISSFASWNDIKKNFRPIVLLSVGHVIFITILVALFIHALIPQLDWPLAFLLGAVISPPDDVAIVSIAEKIRMPSRVVTILEGEGMLNDATALTLFRFALAAVVTHQFSPLHAMTAYVSVIVGETLYGLLVGFVIGELRLRFRNTSLHMIVSLLTPFIAYIPAEMLGGCGVLATAVTGFVIGNRYALRFLPEFRLVSRAVWPTLTFAIQSILFLMVGLDFRAVLERNSMIAPQLLWKYGLGVVAVVIIGRFIWVYLATYSTRLFSKTLAAKDPAPPWQYPFLISWAGMRGAISLAAALAVPVLPLTIEGANARDLLVFLVFCVIVVTLVIQGLTLPPLLKILGLHKRGQKERYANHLLELKVRLKLARMALRWLLEYKKEVKSDPKLVEPVKVYIESHRLLKAQLKERIDNHDIDDVHDEKEEAEAEIFLQSKIIDIERAELLNLWRDEKITLVVRDKLLERLDHRSKNLAE
jgi:monovalent cation/hydrogen antiporter